LINITTKEKKSAYSCEKWTITSNDGYVNIRSIPKVNMNIVGVLITGTGIEFESKNQTWVQIDSPVRGWIAKNQISKLSCNDSIKLLIKTGFPKINSLGKQAIQNDSQSAKILVKLASTVDGLTAEVYSNTVANWANQNPLFLISILKEEQSLATCQAFLNSLHFGLGKSSARGKFEKSLITLSSNSSMVKYWFSIK
jgi:hypothetical protein